MADTSLDFLTTGTTVIEEQEECYIESSDEDEEEIKFEPTEDALQTEMSLFCCSTTSLLELHQQYPLLTTLNIIGLPIRSLDGVQQLLHLKELLVVKCRLENVSAVEHCYKLEKLYLYSNNIQEIPDLKYVKNLQTLWLSGNQISAIKNLEKQKSITELYLDNNNIKEIGISLLQNRELKTLNLSANPLVFLKEISNLAHVPSISTLLLADPLYHPCPMVGLSNYRSYIVQHLPRLHNLDGYRINEDERSRVMLFYKNLVHQYNIVYHKQLSDYYKEVQVKETENRQRLAKFRECFTDYVTKILKEIRTQEKVESSSHLSFKTKLEHLDVTIKNWTAHVAGHRKFLETMRKVRQSQLECQLQNAENLKFVEHDKNTELVGIFSKIMNSFCCSYLKRKHNITGVKVTRVTQVLNRGLRGVISKNNKTSDVIGNVVTSLLVSPTPANPLSDWPFHILERGFGGCEEFTVCITDCLGYADLSWMKEIEKFKKSNIRMSEQLKNEIRVVVIVQFPKEKVLLKHSDTDIPEDKMDEKISESPESAESERKEYESQRTCEMYRLSKTKDVIPFCVVEYQYLYEDDNLKVFQQNMGWEIHSGKSSVLSKVSCHLNLPTLISYLPVPSTIATLTEISLEGCNIVSIEDDLPVMPTVIYLNLSCNQIRKFPRMDVFPKLKRLNISYNCVYDFRLMSVMPSLEYLDISWNMISRILSFFKVLKMKAPNITELNVGFNPTEDVINPYHILFFATKHLSDIKKFNGQPVCPFVSSLSNIQVVEEKGTENEIETDLVETALISVKWKAELYNDILNTKYKGFSHHPADNQSWIFMRNTNIGKIQLSEKTSRLQWIDLSFNFIDDISFLSNCPNVKELSLEHNVIQQLGAAFLALNNLVCLNLSQNYLTSLKEFSNSNFPSLKLLDVSSNNITDVRGIESCKTLEEFYFASNLISEYDDLSCFKECKSLRIIDMSGNPFEAKRNAVLFLIYHYRRIEVINGYVVQNSDVCEANQVFGGSLNRDYLIRQSDGIDLNNLTELTLSRCSIKKIELTKDTLPSLKSLDLSYNNVPCLAGIHELLELETLCLSGNQVVEMGEIANGTSSANIFPRLKILYLDSNGITSVTPLELDRLTRLKHLFLHCNRIDSLAGIKNLTHLKSLIIDCNRISDINHEEVAAFPNLINLYIERNKLKNLEFVKDLYKLQKLYMSYNKISDPDQLKYLVGLNDLEEVTLIGNPVCRHHTEYHDVTGHIPWFCMYSQYTDGDESIV